jgi:hypothetical protein
MKENNDINDLIGEINKTLNKIRSINSLYLAFKRDKAGLPEDKPYALMILSEIFSDFYTCIETAFLRISKFFENNIDRERWHKDLLEKMTLEIPDTRPQVISDEIYTALEEYLRFRHFKRYYFELKYDHKRMAYLESRFDETVEGTQKEFEEFIVKLKMLQQKICGDESE